MRLLLPRSGYAPQQKSGPQEVGITAEGDNSALGGLSLAGWSVLHALAGTPPAPRSQVGSIARRYNHVPNRVLKGAIKADGPNWAGLRQVGSCHYRHAERLRAPDGGFAHMAREVPEAKIDMIPDEHNPSCEAPRRCVPQSRRAGRLRHSGAETSRARSVLESRSQ